MAKNTIVRETIHANGIDISVYTKDFESEYISLTDIARFRSSDPRITIHSWLRSRDVVELNVTISIRLRKMPEAIHTLFP